MIACGNHRDSDTKVYHATVALVRKCFLDPDATMGCYWLSQDGWTEDGEPNIRECGGLIWETARGWECEFGHGGVTAEVRAKEGWDYAHDAEEAARLREHGINAVAMDGGSI